MTNSTFIRRLIRKLRKGNIEDLIEVKVQLGKEWTDIDTQNIILHELVSVDIDEFNIATLTFMNNHDFIWKSLDPEYLRAMADAIEKERGMKK
jgi:hypothetical protein